MMKRKSRLLLLLVLVGCFAVLALTSCDALFGGDDPTEAEYRAAYDAYASYMAEENKEALSYEAWLESVKGPKGDKGDKGADGLTPFIGANGNWWIGMTDTGVRAAGTDGEKGDKGDRGQRGEDGRGIESMELIGGYLMVFYTDGTWENLGRIDGTGTAPITTAPTPATTSAPSTTAPPPADKWAGVSFKGETLKIEYNTHTHPTMEVAGTNNSNKYITGPDEYSPNGVDKALWERNKAVLDQLGMTIEYTTDKTSAVNELLPHYEQMSLAGVSPHIYITQNYGLVRAEVAGLLHNLKNDDANVTNYFVFEGAGSEGWYMDIMNSTTLSSDELYVASGDFLLDSLRMSYNTFVNVSMFDEKFAMYDGMDYLYQLILEPSEYYADSAWSYDTMKMFAEAATTPNLQDESLSVYGLLANNFAYRSFFFSSGLDVFTYAADGTPSYVTDITDPANNLHDYTDALISLLGPRSEYLPLLGSAESGNVKCLERFQNGLGLFMTDQFLCTLEGYRLQDMDDDVAVIPYPKYDLSKDYRVLVSDNACSAGIAGDSDPDGFTMASAYMQMMTEYSNEVIRQYFDVSLKRKNNKAQDPKQIEVLDLIREAVAEPMSFLFDNYVSREITDAENPYVASGTASTIYDLLQHSVEGDSNSLYAGWARNIDAKRAKLASIVLKFQD